MTIRVGTIPCCRNAGQFRLSKRGRVGVDGKTRNTNRKLGNDVQHGHDSGCVHEIQKDEDNLQA